MGQILLTGILIWTAGQVRVFAADNNGKSAVVANRAMDANAICAEMKARYRAIRSLEVRGYAVGTIESADANSIPQTSKTEFLIRLRRPEAYCIEWKGVMASGAVFNTDSENVIINNGERSVVKSMDMAIAASTGAGGATLPGMFYDTWGDTMCTNMKMLREEKFDGERCYVITQSLRPGVVTTYWIGELSMLLMKKQVRNSKFSKHPVITSTEFYTDYRVNPTLSDDQMLPESELKTAAAPQVTPKQPIVKSDPNRPVSDLQQRTRQMLVVLQAIKAYLADPENKELWPPNLVQLRKYITDPAIDFGRYEYTRPSNARPGDPAAFVVLRDRIDSGQLVGYADGHVEFFRGD
jgi:hypothetical protein